MYTKVAVNMELVVLLQLFCSRYTGILVNPVFFLLLNVIPIKKEVGKWGRFLTAYEAFVHVFLTRETFLF